MEMHHRHHDTSEDGVNGSCSGVPNGYVNGYTNGVSASASSIGSTIQKNSQTPIAIIGIACRLPGHCNTPKEFWDFIMRGGVARNEPPRTRFSLAGHYDSSRKPYTMKTPGAMFMEDVDPADFDAGFFNINRMDASSMDPQQRNLMEVAYECLENAGIPVEKLSGQRVGCLVGANTVDYYDMTCRDPEDRTESPTMGSNRALLSNRISHFLNVHGPSISLDTACSSTLIALDMACLYLQSNQVDAMLVGGANMYLSPERNQDMGAMRPTASPTGRCHAFDSKADGYVAAEAINMVLLKRLDDAVEDRDPIRAVVRGTSTNSSGRTPGIAMPDAAAQAAAIRLAYANAGISDSELGETGFLECHGTGTLVGDPIEVEGVASVFAPTRPAGQPLIIGSVKSNIGHSEGAAGISGLIKAVLAIEHKTIPGTATFLTPNPKIDFIGSRVRASRNPIRWPRHSKHRASINSFGFGGANAHAVIESPEYLLGSFAPRHTSSYINTESIGGDFFQEDHEGTSSPSVHTSRPRLIVLSANDEGSLKAGIKTLSSHLLNPAVGVGVDDLAYTLSERRSQLYHRAYSIHQPNAQISSDSFVLGKRTGQQPKIGFVFTGQGAQWPMMGKDLLRAFPTARKMVERLDAVLASLPDPPSWSLVSELTEERDPAVLRQPEFSQPLVTALQLAYLEVLSDWGITPVSVVGHSSGEIAAAVAAGYLTADEAIKVAFFRGKAATHFPPSEKPLGMLAVGTSAKVVMDYIDINDDLVQVACLNSPRSITLSGTVQALHRVKDRLDREGHFARMLQVNLAYHSKYMSEIGKTYEDMLHAHCNKGAVEGKRGQVAMFSSVSGVEMQMATDAAYWRQNMVSPVRFEEAASALIQADQGANFLIEIGPSGALAGPISQIFEAVAQRLSVPPTYASCAQRGAETLLSLYGTAGKVFASGGSVDLASVNEYATLEVPPSTLIDLPNYVWNHSTKYWHESLASKDWRYRPFVRHDLLGSKILGTSWHAPIWRNRLRLRDNPWLKDHKLGDQVVFPGSGYVAMTVEAIYQASYMTTWGGEVPEKCRYRLKDVKFSRALVLDESVDSLVMLSLTAVAASTSPWQEFKVSSLKGDGDVWYMHASGYIRIETEFPEVKAPADITSPLRNPTPARIWYKCMRDAGFNFGPSFQKHLAMEYTAGQRHGRSTVSLEPPLSNWPQSWYPIHPACVDGCFQTVTSSVWEGDGSSVNAALVPFHIDGLVIPFRPDLPKVAVSVAHSQYSGVGRREVTKNYSSSCTVFHPETGELLLEMQGLRYTELDSARETTLSHTYAQLTWDADITLLSEAGYEHLRIQSISQSGEGAAPDSSLAEAQRFIGLAAHKNPNMTVLEVNLDPTDTSSLWLEKSALIGTARASFSSYTLVSSNANSIVTAQEDFAGVAHTEFIMLDLMRDTWVETQKFDLAIVKIPATTSTEVLLPALETIRSCLDDKGLALIAGCGGETSETVRTVTAESGFGSFWCSSSVAIAYSEGPKVHTGSRDICLVKFINSDTQEIEVGLHKLAWRVSHVIDPYQINRGSKVLVVDELTSPVMSTMDQNQWAVLQHLISIECDIVWVTRGAQMSPTEPTKALVNGLFRVIRNEEPLISLINLDVEHSSGDNTIEAMDKCLKLLYEDKTKTKTESEFVERNGVLYISRVLPDLALNVAKEEEITGRPAEMMHLHSSQTTIKLRAERIGNIESLHYSEVAAEPLPLEENGVEIKVLASGVNFKEVAVVMGIVPENEYLLGGEGSGIVTRVAPDVTKFTAGQRVAFFEKGSFGTLIQTKTEAVHAIPDSMTFEEAATIPCVFMTSMYSLFHLARVKKGDRVLVHSATGGVGISAIQLCQHVGAKVYATVGTVEKREFLKSTFAIPDEHIFSSRTKAFGDDILKCTDGKGVNIILNSLTGELLDESWRIIADGGTMVEIGKKDILDRNRLSMEPFNRNASFRALDLSHKEISDEMIASLLSDIFALMEKGHLKPISPVQVFSFANIPAALRLIRSGKHIGKLVVSDGEDSEVEVPVRRARRSGHLCCDVSYLIVGGLRGLCSSLAIYLAKNGARHLVVISRSGHDDERSQKVARDIRALGCDIALLRADVTSIEDVREVFRKTSPPIAGIIQGAMVLRDRTFASMTIEEYHTALEPKVRGTWNLHNVSVEQDLPIHFFTMLSSISGLCGSKGQANYAAGNAFLDAFASYRQALGLAACSVDLGVIEDVGYIAEHEGLQDRYDPTIWHAINERLLRKIFHFSIQQQHSSPINPRSAAHMITGIQVPQPEDSSMLRDARFAALSWTGGIGTQEGARDGSKDIQALLVMIRSKAESKAVLDAALQILGRHFAKSLRLTEALDFTRPLSTYGIDSLAAVEFRNFVKVDMGVELTTLEVVNAASLVSICEKVISRIRSE